MSPSQYHRYTRPSPAPDTVNKLYAIVPHILCNDDYNIIMMTNAYYAMMTVTTLSKLFMDIVGYSIHYPRYQIYINYLSTQTWQHRTQILYSVFAHVFFPFPHKISFAYLNTTKMEQHIH